MAILRLKQMVNSTNIMTTPAAEATSTPISQPQKVAASFRTTPAVKATSIPTSDLRWSSQFYSRTTPAVEAMSTPVIGLKRPPPHSRSHLQPRPHPLPLSASKGLHLFQDNARSRGHVRSSFQPQKVISVLFQDYTYNRGHVHSSYRPQEATVAPHLSAWFTSKETKWLGSISRRVTCLNAKEVEPLSSSSRHKIHPQHSLLLSNPPLGLHHPQQSSLLSDPPLGPSILNICRCFLAHFEAVSSLASIVEDESPSTYIIVALRPTTKVVSSLTFIVALACSEAVSSLAPVTALWPASKVVSPLVPVNARQPTSAATSLQCLSLLSGPPIRSSSIAAIRPAIKVALFSAPAVAALQPAFKVAYPQHPLLLSSPPLGPHTFSVCRCFLVHSKAVSSSTSIVVVRSALRQVCLQAASPSAPVVAVLRPTFKATPPQHLLQLFGLLRGHIFSAFVAALQPASKVKSPSASIVVTLRLAFEVALSSTSTAALAYLEATPPQCLPLFFRPTSEATPP
ncbi:hypothetical protein ACLOJK_014249 [Asimina triloba]